MGPHAAHYGVIGFAVLAVAALGLRRPPEAQEDLAPGARPAGDTLMDGLSEPLVVPVALVSSAAAAGVHAAMGPPHFGEHALFGLFFALAAGLQVSWAVLLVTRRDTAFLVAGALANVAVMGIWASSRTIGLPFGLLREPEAVRPWDLACAGWELAVVVACCLLLRRSARARVTIVPWRDWHRSARAYAGGSTLMIAALVVAGASG